LVREKEGNTRKVMAQKLKNLRNIRVRDVKS
jgi:hypothetical protein